MNTELYIELLEAEIARQRTTIGELEFEVRNAKRLYDPMTKLKDSLEKDLYTTPSLQGLAEITKAPEMKPTHIPPAVDDAKYWKGKSSD